MITPILMLRLVLSYLYFVSAATGPASVVLMALAGAWLLANTSFFQRLESIRATAAEKRSSFKDVKKS